MNGVPKTKICRAAADCARAIAQSNFRLAHGFFVMKSKKKTSYKLPHKSAEMIEKILRTDGFEPSDNTVPEVINECVRPYYEAVLDSEAAKSPVVAHAPGLAPEALRSKFDRWINDIPKKAEFDDTARIDVTMNIQSWVQLAAIAMREEVPIGSVIGSMLDQSDSICEEWNRISSSAEKLGIQKN